MTSKFIELISLDSRFFSVSSMPQSHRARLLPRHGMLTFQPWICKIQIEAVAEAEFAGGTPHGVRSK
jgi:hypothetical protein